MTDNSFSSELLNDKPIKLLGLPDPEGLNLDDPLLLDVYYRFCKTLKVVSNEDVVMSDPNFADLQGLSDNEENAMAKLKLACALIRPNENYLQFLYDRTFDVDEIDYQKGQFAGHLYDYSIGRAFREFSNFRTTRDYKVLTKDARDLKLLDALESETSTAPGLTWFTRLDCINWNNEWGVALFYRDSEDEQCNAFPVVLGFFRMNRYPYSSARLLTELPEFWWLCEEATVFGNDLLTACWKRLGDEGEFPLCRYLLELDDLTIEKLRNDYHRIDSDQFFRDAKQLWGDARAYLDMGYEDNVLKYFMDEFGYKGLRAFLTAGIDGDDLLSACWQLQTEHDDFPFCRHLLELDDITIKRLRNDYDGEHLGEFVEDVMRIWAYARHDCNMGYDENVLKYYLGKLGYAGLRTLLVDIKNGQ